MKQRYLLIATIDVETAGLGASTKRELENAAATYFGCVLAEKLEDDDRIVDLVTYRVADDYDVDRVRPNTRTGPEDARPRVVRTPNGMYLTGTTKIDAYGIAYAQLGPRDKAWVYTSYVAYNDADECRGEVIFVEDET